MAGLFDKQSDVYAAARPDYPNSLYELLLSLNPHRGRAWDVGTGNGQAAVELARHFEQVIATDVSDKQLKLAPRRPNITYAVTSKNITEEELERVVGPEGSVDLVTVAQALHWFDLDAFYAKVRHVLRKPDGVIAAWSYQLCFVDPAVDVVIREFYTATFPYWAPQRALVDEEYTTISFPFEPVPEVGKGPLRMETKKELSLEQLLLYFRSWSAIQTALDQGVFIIEEFREAFTKAWGDDPSVVKTVTWPVHLLVGKVSDQVC